ncbi:MULTISPECIES: transcriptional regulator GutM [unclassified Brenneria]|uniref:transcriptional regulator GutM n=1 Tax=unclassified Brenneria TaxID=2634434 RepID=UPI0029C249B2|nr:MULTISPECIES: transcriptional regulator GutM [unclassified Brenneria]MDX5629435.1 transcriptional regulator GutM [Brenneria sp. L3-3Z]MDX5696574.1 transcriptional regulator GutM [Brenneria sp. L4-2C]MEE3663399.1 transcriptional regulator GutM [Brenneria sp. g21c3]
MTPASLLISCAIGAWLLQIALGWWQLRRFNQAFDALYRQGCKVGVGRSAGRFKARVIVALAFDEQDRVQDGFIMRGLTVFARPRQMKALIGLKREQLAPSVIFPIEPSCRAALSLAIEAK